MTNGSRVWEAGVGAAAGIAAAFLMNRFQGAWSKLSKALEPDRDDRGDNEDSIEPATVKAADKLRRAITGHPVPEKRKEAAGSLVHYAFGATLGVIYVLAGRISPGFRVGYGTAYGAGVSIVADEILVPATGLSPPPTKSPAWSHVYGFVSHIVFGAALEGSRRLIAKAPG